ncbi:hypothetical protein LCGC14_1273980 [marine sediment metagenome]|uniref:Uncharacterized protein n=1 Tax=marine sediment metagenome TaxID=412755 RepID=A0A0F9P0D0_9ZZZZ
MSFPTIIHGSEPEVFNSYSTERAGVGIGAKLILPDGRHFRYTHAGGTALVVGSLNQAVVHTVNFSGEAVGTAAAGARVLPAVGSTTGSVAIDQLKFGYAYTDNTTALPMMQIKSNTAIVHNAASDIGQTITLFTPIPTALVGGTSTLCYFENPWEDIIVTPGTGDPTSIIVGICKIALTEAYWGWVQSAGPTTALYDSSVQSIAGIGDPVAPDGTVSGAVAGGVDQQADTVQLIGTALGLVEADGEQTPIFLSID